MKLPRKLLTIVVGALVLFSMTGCNQDNSNEKEDTEGTKIESEVSSSEEKSHYPVTITTYNYKKEPVEMTFDKAPENVLAVYQNSIELMLALGLEDNIGAAAGLDHKVKPEWEDAFSKVEYLEDFTPGKEDTIMGQYDFILGWYSLFGEKKLGEIDYWNENGTNTYMAMNSGVLDTNNLDNEVHDILNLGKIFNVEDKAQEIVDEINNEIKRVTDLVKDKEEETTLIIEFGSKSITAYGKNSLGGDMVTKLGADLLMDKSSSIGKEDIVNLNPDSIFVVYMDREGEDVATQSLEMVTKDKGLQNLDAVKNNRVHTIPLGEMYSSGVRTIDGLNTFIEGLYPDLNEGE